MPYLRGSLETFLTLDLSVVPAHLSDTIASLVPYSLGYNGFLSAPFSIGNFLAVSETFMAAEQNFNFIYEDIEQVYDRISELDPVYGALFQAQSDAYLDQLRIISQTAADAMDTTVGDWAYIAWTVVANGVNLALDLFGDLQENFNAAFSAIRLGIEAATFGVEVYNLLTEEEGVSSANATRLRDVYQSVIEPMTIIDDALSVVAEEGLTGSSATALFAALTVRVSDIVAAVQGLTQLAPDNGLVAHAVTRVAHVIVATDEFETALAQMLAVRDAKAQTGFSDASEEFLSLAERSALWKTMQTFTNLVSNVVQLWPGVSGTPAAILNGFTNAADTLLDAWDDISLLEWRNQWDAYEAAEPSYDIYAGFQTLLADGLDHLDSLTGGTWGTDIGSLASLEGIMYFGSSDADSIAGTAGGDRVWGGAGNDSVQGGAGRDRLWGEAGADTLEGGAGNDILTDEGLYNVIYGGGDDDIVRLTVVADATNLAWGGTGTDTLDLVITDGRFVNVGLRNSSNQNVDFASAFTNWQTAIAGGHFTINGSFDNARFREFEIVNIDASANNSADGGWIWYMNGTRYIGQSTRANGFIANWSAQTAAIQWDMADQGEVTLGNGVTVGNFGDVYIALGSGADSMTALGLADYIDAGGGNDTLDGGGGDDTLLGGGGNDVFNLPVGSHDDVRADGGTGADTLNLSLTLSGETYGRSAHITFRNADGMRIDFNTAFANWQTAVAGGFFSVRSDYDRGEYRGFEVVNIDASGTNAFGGDIWYMNGTRYIGESGGTSRFVANWSAQTAAVNWTVGTEWTVALANGVTVGQFGQVHIALGSGNDTLTGAGRDDYIDGGAGNEVLTGGAGIDTLIGGAGNDIIHSVMGETEADVVRGGSGTDRMNLILTSDYYGSGAHIVMRDAAGDAIDFATAFADWTGAIAGGHFTARQSYGGHFSGLEIVNIDASAVTEGGGDIWYMNDTRYIGQSAGISRLVANWSAQSVALTYDMTTEGETLLANSVTVGNFSRLYLALGSGNDSITAGGLADHLDGGRGSDILHGGLGSDSLLGGEADDFLYGGGGNDTLTGGYGNDALAGAAGADTYQFDPQFGGDSLLDTDGGVILFEGRSASAASLSRDGSVLVISFAGSTDQLRILNYFVPSGARWSFHFSGNSATLNTATLTDPWDSLGRAVSRVGTDSAENWQLLDYGEFVYLNGGNDVVQAGAGADLIDGGAGNDRVSYADSAAGVTIALNGTIGSGGDAAGDLLRNVEALVGSDHADTLAGGSPGADSLAGGMGNDLYTVSSYSDVVIEAANSGTDTVQTALAAYSIFATAHVENLTGLATTGQSLTGNSFANVLTGNAGNDRLIGASGDDTLLGNGGNDTLEGGTGTNMLTGGAGNDVYVVSSFSDVLTEGAGAGTDTVQTALGAFSIFTKANIENVISTTTSSVKLTGNSLNNRLTGNDVGKDFLVGSSGNDTLIGLGGNDSLDGGSGADSMAGGRGNDTYVVDTLADVVNESANQGADTIRTNLAAFSIRAIVNVENLAGFNGTGQTLTGSADANRITGHSGADHLLGGGGNDTLLGGAGADTLSGGLGADVFSFNTAQGAGDIDRISDFSVTDDRIELENAVFAALGLAGVLGGSAFHTGAAATSAAHRLIYNAATGQLFFDADGAGANAQIQIATLSAGLALTSADFTII